VLEHVPRFHSTDIEGYRVQAAGITEQTWTHPHAADLILKNDRAIIWIGGDRVFCLPTADHIGFPRNSAFRGPPDWAVTALHELGHRTGHKSRLDLEEGMRAVDRAPTPWRNYGRNSAARLLPPNLEFQPTSRSTPATSARGSGR
jgi:antirestriction protein ArdC